MTISARGITKRFGAVTALAGVSFEVAAAQCLGITGPAGSGRTTLLRILATVLRPSSGTVIIGGLDAGEQLFTVRTRIAYAGAECLAGTGLRVGEYLRFVLHTRGARAGIEHTRRVREALEEARVSATALVDALVPPARGALAIAIALVVRPDVLIVDDLLDGMDVRVRGRFHECLDAARSHGSTIVLATNDDTTLGAVCQRALRLDGGRVVSPVGPEAPSLRTPEGPRLPVEAGLQPRLDPDGRRIRTIEGQA